MCFVSIKPHPLHTTLPTVLTQTKHDQVDTSMYLSPCIVLCIHHVHSSFYIMYYIMYTVCTLQNMISNLHFQDYLSKCSSLLPYSLDQDNLTNLYVVCILLYYYFLTLFPIVSIFIYSPYSYIKSFFL